MRDTVVNIAAVIIYIAVAFALAGLIGLVVL